MKHKAILVRPPGGFFFVWTLWPAEVIHLNCEDDLLIVGEGLNGDVTR